MFFTELDGLAEVATFELDHIFLNLNFFLFNEVHLRFSMKIIRHLLVFELF